MNNKDEILERLIDLATSEDITFTYLLSRVNREIDEINERIKENQELLKNLN